MGSNPIGGLSMLERESERESKREREREREEREEWREREGEGERETGEGGSGGSRHQEQAARARRGRLQTGADIGWQVRRPCNPHTLPGRLELPTLRLTASRSNQLS
jgi:hypothetical protein